VYRGQIQLPPERRYRRSGALQKALKDDPNNAVAHFQLGAAFDMQHNDARAESEWRDAVRLRPDLTDAQTRFSRARAAPRRPRRAHPNRAANHRQCPASPDGYLMRALAEIESPEIFRRATRPHQSHGHGSGKPGALRARWATCISCRSRYLEAIKFYRQALDKDAASTDALQGNHECLLLQKQPDQAIAAASAQIAKSPSTGGFYDLLARPCLQNKKILSGAEARLPQGHRTRQE